MLEQVSEVATAVSPTPAPTGTDAQYHHSNLTRLQMLYWVGQRLRPDAPIFTGALAFTFKGPLNTAAFQAAFQTVAAHSDALCTVVCEEDGIPQQRLLPPSAPLLAVVDFSEDPDPAVAAWAWISEHVQIVPDITARLFDSALLRLDDENHIWFLNQHHLMTDAASTYLTYDHVLAAYASQTGTEATIATLQSRPFTDYVAYEHSYLGSGMARRAAAFWEQKLADPLPTLHYFGQNAQKHGTAVNRVTITLPPDTTVRLRELSQQPTFAAMTGDLSRFNLLGVLFFTLIHRMTGESRLSFISPIHNRPTQAFRETIGLLMELCPFVLDFQPDDTFTDLLIRMNKSVRGIMRHYQYGTSLSQENRLHDIMFNVHDRPELTFNGEPVVQQMVHPGAGSDTLALHIHDEKSSETMIANFDFHADVFSPEQQQMAVTAFQMLIDACLADPDQPVAQVALPWQPQDVELAISETAEDDADKRPYQPPRDMLEFQLQQVWETVLETNPVGMQDDFFELGGNSWQAMRLFVQIEKLTGTYFPLATLLEANTIEKLAEKLRHQTTDTWKTLVTIQKGAAEKRPLFLIPGAGGNGLVVARIAKYLPADQPVYTFLIPGLVGDDLPPTTIEDIATHYVTALCEEYPEEPYLIGGYSAGGIVAYEVASQLQRMGKKVALCAIIDAPAQSEKFEVIQRLVNRLGKRQNWSAERQQNVYLAWRDFFFRAHYFMYQGWREAPREVARTIKRLLQRQKQPHQSNQQVPYVADEYGSQMEDARMRAIYEINDRAVRTYFPRKYAGKLVLIKSIGGYERPSVRSPYADMGWGRIAEGGVEIYKVPGSHMQMVREPFVAVISEHLQTCLSQL